MKTFSMVANHAYYELLRNVCMWSKIGRLTVVEAMRYLKFTSLEAALSYFLQLKVYIWDMA